MTEVRQIYKCEKCGNIVEVLHAGAGELSCCGEPMKLIKAGVTDAAQEKHVPVIEKKDKGYHVQVGSVAHPMEQKHSIEWIELITPTNSYMKFLKPEEKPEAFFEVVEDGPITVRAYCNLHGLWAAEK